MNNLAMAGGFLMLTAQGPDELSIDNDKHNHIINDTKHVASRML